MITLLIPQFDDHLQYTGLAECLIKNNPDTSDYNKVICLLPGLPQGYCEEIYTISKTGKPIPIAQFYDPRQGNLKKLKNFFITLKSSTP